MPSAIAASYDKKCKELIQLIGWDDHPTAASASRRAREKPSQQAMEYGKTTNSSSVSEETDLLSTGFTLRKIGPNAIRIWLFFQVVGVVFQAILWCKVSWHLSEYDAVILQECAPERSVHGVCQGGTMWNVSYWQELVLWGDESSSFTFVTRSMPPTLLINVAPVPLDEGDAEYVLLTALDLDDSEWALEVNRILPEQQGHSFQKYQLGKKALTMEDLSSDAAAALRSQGYVKWQAKLTSRISKRQRLKFVVFVEDAITPHLAEIHASRQCSFGPAWRAFNEQAMGTSAMGTSHRAMEWCRSLLGTFLLVGIAAIVVVHRESILPSALPESVDRLLGKHRFHAVVAAKFVLQDMPQQICIVLYLLGWFEAAGLRCQLCLFEPRYCVEEHPFCAANSIALGCTLLSAVANQLLIRPVLKKSYDECDICMQGTLRIMLVSLATLPFTTGIWLASGSLLTLPAFFHFLVAVPCGIGWMIVMGVVSFPIVGCYVRMVETCENHS
eukprot:gnl/TRDRNA2_/TRDRNA2_157611_c0_seq2.p1 gnl/TRDRNA2_/TRDRNA2_157611_c0~~gnl/TRDRNA2_/TRDRNA2_157611_c0_seq2.p1  ORF type:complete len:500 (-),score=82.97 gnl/TRDRNA2_/TRDRNA2_157611_c0_seq2:66-1565(-)